MTMIARPARLARLTALAVRRGGRGATYPSLALIEVARLRRSALPAPGTRAAVARAVALPSIAIPTDEKPSAAFPALDGPDS